MGNLCSKRKRSDSGSIKSEGSAAGKKTQPTTETLPNHSQDLKGQNGQSQGNGDGAAGTSSVSTDPASTSTAPKGAALQRGRIMTEEPSISGDSTSLQSPTGVGAGGGGDTAHPFALPPEMKKQTDNVQNLMLGRLSRTKPVAKGRKITLYVCVSFSQDFRLEKGKLHTEVYPKLREHCSNQGYELHIIDLHWKTELEDKEDHQFPELCLEELRREQDVSYVIPVLFLSNSLGASLLPKTVEQQDFEMALKNVGDPESRKLLEKWYTLDSHSQPPCFRLKPISTHFPNIASDNESEKQGAINEWHSVKEQILGVMLRVFTTELRDTYLTTVIEQEIHNSIFMSRETGKRTVWVNRVFTHLQAGQDAESSSPIENEKDRRLQSLHNELKSQLVADHILRLLVKWQEGGLSLTSTEHCQYLDELSKQLSSQLRGIIDEIIEEDKTKAMWKTWYGVDGRLCSELNQQNIFCQQSAKCSLPIENVVSSIKQYVSSDKTYPLVVHGETGSGKTGLLSRVVQQCGSWLPDAFIIFRFVGVTPESRSLVQILRTIVSQLGFLLKGRSYWIPHNVQWYKKELYKLITAATSPSPSLLLIIDGLDELSPLDIAELNWLSEPLPPRVRMILSCSEGTSVFQFLKTNLKQDGAFLALSPLTQQAAECLLTASILQYSHSVDSEVQKRLCARVKPCSLPLYIKILAWLSSMDVQGLVDLNGVTDVKTAIGGLFEFLEKSFGKQKVEQLMALVCASRYGLCDSELLDLLAQSPIFCSSVTFLDWAPASLFLAQICKSLGPFLEWSLAGNSLVIRCRDRLLFDLAKEKYLNPSQEKKIRKEMIDYFEGNIRNKKKGRDLNKSTSSSNRHHRRELEEIPYQQLRLNGTIKTACLCNLDWLLDKLQTSSVYSVIEDIAFEAQGDTTKLDSDLSLLLKLLELSASALQHDGRQLLGQLYGRLLPVFKNESAEVSSSWSSKCPLMKSIFLKLGKPSIPNFLPVSSSVLHSPIHLDDSSCAVKSLENLWDLCEGPLYFDELIRFKVGNQFSISLSTSKEEVVVWDVYGEKPVRTLRGVFNPNSLKVIDETRVVILCGRELQLFNLDDGSFVCKLKGVMNQKMPFFGLHDEQHLVALSRNRMYVNLINMETGDCVTTFKVGEDRFLNSLIVSENGKILVCGDETQKPFPLLVWDLTSRKLLYDLRIPHHEFLTNLAAITKEGHFVCCVCREVDDPGPNFIVVYDLQSGTLFKKWKPGYSTLAISISAQGGCVINALEDNRILVWDLVTGACKYSLSKHTAPANMLRLDYKGSRCLSCDSTGRDRTICLWDLTNGSLLALFTPDTAFSACEVTNDGLGIMIGLRGKSDISTLLYKTKISGDSEQAQETFGKEDNQGKVTDLKSPT
ncbi:NACHT and WD repeat domain-containing protein 2 [Orchesella cincta]|uniref:NACHT and WD repeat domain-containing protein 2 n=1 Tax=Orchesella cincta TaxID=48709 RepID=A0A1D2MLL7_ORCCI|nr:NACHT and WD repeat domain-containing protein 2 [Orchesella cincta]